MGGAGRGADENTYVILSEAKDLLLAPFSMPTHTGGRPWPMLGVAALAVAISGCDPVAAVYVRQSLAPAPADSCIANALASSPLVAHVGAATHRPRNGFDVTVRDSSDATRSAGKTATVGLQTAHDSAVVTVKFHLWGKMTRNVEADESRELGKIASAIAQTVRAACAPNSPAADTCLVTGMWSTKPCGR